MNLLLQWLSTGNITWAWCYWEGPEFSVEKGNILCTVQPTTCIYIFQHLTCKRFASTLCLVIFVRDLFSRFSRVKTHSRKVKPRNFSCPCAKWTVFQSYQKLPYTQVNKCIRLFPKLQGNMRLLPNMHLICNEGKNWPHPKTVTPFW